MSKPISGKPVYEYLYANTHANLVAKVSVYLYELPEIPDTWTEDWSFNTVNDIDKRWRCIIRHHVDD